MLHHPVPTTPGCMDLPKMVLTDVGPTGEQPNTQVTKAGKSDWDFLHNNSVSFKIAVSVTFITFQSAALLILLMRVSSLRSVDFFWMFAKMNHCNFQCGITVIVSVSNSLTVSIKNE